MDTIPGDGVPPGEAPGKRERLRGVVLLLLFLLFLGTLAVYWQTGGHPFLNLDDRAYVEQNRTVLRGLTPAGAKWAFTTFQVANWHPLAWLSHMADVSLFGPAPGWHHRVNALLHAANAALLLLVLFRMTGAFPPSLLAASLFAFHPLHVESVAWISERKDLLCAFFTFLSLLAWERRVRRPGGVPYALSLAAFALALLSKPMAVTLPFLLLLLDGWPFGRLSRAALPRLLVEKAPFFLLSALSCAVTMYAQGAGGAVHTLVETPFSLRFQNAVASYGIYLRKTAWPSDLAVFYPHPATVGGTVPLGATALSLLALAVLSAAAWRQRKAMPWIAVGWLWYLGTLVPVIGLVQVGSQAMADRYTYLPLVGIFVAIAFSVAAAAERFPRAARPIVAASAAAVLLLCAATYRQASFWKDGVTLYRRAVAVTEGNWLAMTNLGGALDEQGRHDEAIGLYREAIRLWPNDPTPYVNLGASLEKTGKEDEAEEAYRAALRTDPREWNAWYDLGTLLMRKGRLAEAEEALLSAVRITPGDGEAWNHLGMVRARQGDFEGALGYYRKAVESDPEGGARAVYNMALAYARMGDPAKAADAYREAIRLRPAFPEAWANLGGILASTGRAEEARSAFAEAQRLFAASPTSPGPSAPPSPATP